MATTIFAHRLLSRIDDSELLLLLLRLLLLLAEASPLFGVGFRGLAAVPVVGCVFGSTTITSSSSSKYLSSSSSSNTNDIQISSTLANKFQSDLPLCRRIGLRQVHSKITI
uniref:Secreted protein n=1 Tax=Romanomermis culicivorax TaxID=13658 RepID=A0A915KJX3_ROMCU